jgi:hypothetical protein
MVNHLQKGWRAVVAIAGPNYARNEEVGIPVPEPGSLTIVGTALFGLVAYARRKRMTPA